MLSCEKALDKSLILTVWALYPLINYFKIASLHLPIINKFSNYIFLISIIVSISLSYSLIKKYLSVKDFFVYLVFVIIFLLNFILFPQNTNALKDISFDFIFCVLPYYFIGVLMSKISIKKELYLISCISIICFTLFKFFLIYSNYEFEKDSDMSGAYQLLPHLLYVIWFAFDSPNFFNASISILGTVVLLGQGNRGSIFSVILFVFIYIFFFYKSKNSKLVKTILVGLVICITLYIDQINLFFLDYMEELGFSSRLFEKIIEEEVTDLSGRDAISATSLNAIKDSPLLGYGLTADRTINEGMYAHNLFLEMGIAFGPFVSSFIWIFLFFKLIKVIKISNYDQKILLLLMICFGFIPLLFSFSFLAYGWFFMLIGYILSLANQPFHSSKIHTNFLRLKNY